MERLPLTCLPDFPWAFPAARSQAGSSALLGKSLHHVFSKPCSVFSWGGACLRKSLLHFLSGLVVFELPFRKKQPLVAQWVLLSSSRTHSTSCPHYSDNHLSKEIWKFIIQKLCLEQILVQFNTYCNFRKPYSELHVFWLRNLKVRWMVWIRTKLQAPCFFDRHWEKQATPDGEPLHVKTGLKNCLLPIHNPRQQRWLVRIMQNSLEIYLVSWEKSSVAFLHHHRKQTWGRSECQVKSRCKCSHTRVGWMLHVSGSQPGCRPRW